MEILYYYLGFLIFWIAVSALAFTILGNFILAARMWVIRKDFWIYWVARKTMKTDTIRWMYSEYELGKSAKRYAFRYRLRNIKQCQKRR